MKQLKSSQRSDSPAAVASVSGVGPRVSVLIPAYNAGPWIARSIDSAVRQSWPNCEVIVMDDGSTDDTGEIARQFASGRVKVLRQPNAGAAAARNALLKQAQGDYIQWLDADDILHPQKIELQLQGAAPGHRAEVLLTSSWGRFFKHTAQARFAPDSLWQTLTPVQWLTHKFSDNAFMFPATWLVSRRLVDQAGSWDERLTLDDDGEYMCRLVAASKQVAFVPAAQCYYRIGNTSSLSWQKSDKALQSGFQSMALCISYLLALQDNASTRTACLRLVQENYRLFCPAHEALSERCRALAHSLGGTLNAPQERSHFKLFRSVFGWQAANATRSRIDYSRLLTARLLENLSSLGHKQAPHI
jgi:glycosyltransferase involved in cell wall biosynthesis